MHSQPCGNVAIASLCLRRNVPTMPTDEKQESNLNRPRNGGSDLQYFPGVGPHRAELLQRLGITKPIDLLFHFPRSYQDTAKLCGLAELRSDVRASIIGTIDDMELRTLADGRSILGVLVKFESGGYLRLVWFNQPYRRGQLRHGMRVLATGIPKNSGMTWEMRQPEVTELGDGQPIPEPHPEPIYPLTEGLQNHQIKKMIATALDRFLNKIEEALPDKVREQFQLMDVRTALEKIHRPTTEEEATNARKRFIYQELLIYQLALAQRRYQSQHGLPAPLLQSTPQIHARILKRIPFQLTDDQRRAIEEIKQDLNRELPMNRLLQGDVGSGKTVVAMYAMLVAVAHRYQAALMAPTEILARQHAARLKERLANSQVELEFLSGSLSAAERTASLNRIANGSVDIIVGTQALLSDKVEFAKLGVVVIDEQHRFGVQQRASLKQGSSQPHYLVLSATPIPRTLAMTAFGDLDVSVIRSRPTGKVPIHTYLSTSAQYERWWQFVVKQVRQGRQAYVVTARVSQEEDSALLGAEQVYEALKEGPLKELRLGLLHGRMDGDAKQNVLEAFEARSIDVLISTTVVEVGIDVPNATVMTVLDADRLGLSQLHQLRGRVSRGSHPGFFCMFPSNDALVEDNARLQALTNTSDGFALAEMDLQMRGPGNLLGTQQHGLPKFKIADLIRDSAIIMQLRDEARQIIAGNPNLDGPEWKRLAQQLKVRHGEMLSLGDVG